MYKKMLVVLCVAVLAFSATGCLGVTKGSASWEVYSGIRTTQITPPVSGTEPSSAGFESSLADKIIEGSETK